MLNRYISILVLLVIVSCSGCDKVKTKAKRFIEKIQVINGPAETTDSEPEVERKKFSGLRKTHYANGNLKSACEYVNGRRNGLCKTYYEDGTIHMEVNYIDNDKDGSAKWYYKNGNLYEEINYSDGWKTGVHKMYYDNGKLKSEVLYREDKPAIGTKEYYKSGKLKTDYPELVITERNTVAFNNEYVLYISLKGYKGKADLYVGELSDGKFLDPVNLSWLKENGNRWYYMMTIYPGEFVMKKVNVLAKIKTPYGNPYVIQKSFNVSVSND